MWCQAGYDPDSFWTQTPRTLEQALLGYRDRRKAELELAAYGALLSAALRRWPDKQKLPSIEYLIGESKPLPKVQPVEDLNANLRAWGLLLNAGAASR